MMISRVPAPAVSDFRPALRGAGLLGRSPTSKDVELLMLRDEVAVLRPAKPAAPAGLGRSRGTDRVDPVPAPSPGGRSAGHSWHHPAVAPLPREQEVDLPRATRTARVSTEIAVPIERFATETTTAVDTRGSSSTARSCRPTTPG